MDFKKASYASEKLNTLLKLIENRVGVEKNKDAVLKLKILRNQLEDFVSYSKINNRKLINDASEGSEEDGYVFYTTFHSQVAGAVSTFDTIQSSYKFELTNDEKDFMDSSTKIIADLLNKRSAGIDAVKK